MFRVEFLRFVYVILMCSLFLLCFYIHYEKSRISCSFQGYTEIQQQQEVDLTQIFVPQGKRYHSEDGQIYDCITRAIFSRVETVHKTRDFQNDAWSQPGERNEDRAKAFREIFENQTWVQKEIKGSPVYDKLSPEYKASGGGPLEAAQRPLALLNCLVDHLKHVLGKSIISIADIPCGDFYWMRHFVGTRTDIRYTGFDIVPTLIKRHQINFRNMTHAQFRNVDIVSAGLNQSYDVIISRAMLQHLTTGDAMKVLEHFSKSGSKLLVTTNLLGSKNKDLNTKRGRCRRLNLMLPPINLVPPICSITEGIINRANGPRQLSIWTLPLQQRAL